MQGWMTQQATQSSLHANATMLAKVSWKERLFLVGFFAVLSIGLLSPISSTAMIPNLADFINHLATVVQAKAALEQGQFPLRTAPTFFNHLGYPLFQFYSPSSFTFMGLIYWLITPSNPMMAIHIALWFGLMCAGLSMYGLAYWFVRSKPAALLAGVIYLYTPYYVILVNHLGAFQEILALGLLPCVLYLTLQRYYYPKNPTTLVTLSFVVYLFFTVHMPTSVYATVLFMMLLSIITIRNPKRLSNFISVLIAYALAVMLAMWFLAPGMLIQKYLTLNNTYTDANHLILYHPTLSNLLFAGPAFSLGNDSNALAKIHPSVGLPVLMSVLICIFALCNRLTSGKHRADYFMPGLLFIFMIAFLFVWSPINFWRLLPQPLLLAQYSWRLMAQVSWIGALLSAWAICCLFKKNLEVKHVIIGTMLIMVCANPWFKPAEYWTTSLTDFLKNPYLIYNNNAFTINYNQFPNFVNQIESINIDSAKTLRYNMPYRVPESLVNFANHPAIDVQGKLSIPQEISVSVNGSHVASKSFAAGEFAWSIPLNLAKQADQTQVEFTTKTKQTEIPVHEFVLSGFQDPSEIVTLDQIAAHCRHDHTTKVCEMNVPTTAKILEIPQLYYPQLLKVTLNDKVVPYQSILDHSQLVTYVVPHPGELNKVTIEFQGLLWANLISKFAWIAWLLLALQCLYFKSRRIFND